MKKREQEDARRRQNVNAYKKLETGDAFGDHPDEQNESKMDDQNDTRYAFLSLLPEKNKFIIYRVSKLFQKKYLLSTNFCRLEEIF